MAKRKNKKQKELNNGRDFFMLLIIQGATKASVEPDQRKEHNKKACRKRVNKDED